jgi:solute:Na+ symporter, SSS family
LTTAVWVIGTLVTPAESDATLSRFVDKVKPGGPGWRRWSPSDTTGHVAWSVPRGMLSMALGSIGVYATLFATGSWLYGEMQRFWCLAAIALICTLLLLRLNRTRK